jgi:hypothetical protein
MRTTTNTKFLAVLVDKHLGSHGVATDMMLMRLMTVARI